MSQSYVEITDRYDKLLISHEELIEVCKTQMELLLRAGLHIKLGKKLFAAHIAEGFAERAENVQKEFHRERMLLMSKGQIQ